MKYINIAPHGWTPPFIGTEREYQLTLDLYNDQHRARRHWMESGVWEELVSDGLGGALVVHSVSDKIKDNGFEEEVVTNVPEYFSYARLWNKSWYPSPFEVDWFSAFNNDEGELDIKFSYISVVIDTLKEQLLLWGVDYRTRRSLVYWYISEFLLRLEALRDYLFKINSSY